MKIAWLSPLPPVRSGIAGYSMMILPALAKLTDVTVVLEQSGVDPAPPCPVIGIDEYRSARSRFDIAVAQVGNNLHHEFVWREASEHPTVLVLHELVLHHLLTEMTLARGDAERFVQMIGQSEGNAGELFARARASGIHFEEGNFLFPASSRLAASSRRVIVHNQWSKVRLLESGVTTPIEVIDHPLDELKVEQDETARSRIRETFGFSPQMRVIGMFGFVTMPKRPDVVFESFAEALRRNSELRLLVVGESAPNIDLEDLARRHGLPAGSWIATGWTTDRQFDEALLATDRVVGLRYPSAGESSGAVVRIFAAGKPVAVSDYAQFADFPDDVVTKIPLGKGEIESLVTFMTGDSDPDVALAQRRWITEHGDPGTIASAYMKVLRDAVEREPGHEASSRPAHPSTLGLLPAIAVEDFRAVARDGRVEIEADLRNAGDVAIRSHVWGEPAFRLIVKIARDGQEMASEWWPLPADLEPGGVSTVGGIIRGSGADEVWLVHGWTGLPLTDETPFFRGEVSG